MIVNGDIAKNYINVDFDLKIQDLDTGFMALDYVNGQIRAQNCICSLRNISIETAGLSTGGVVTWQSKQAIVVEVIALQTKLTEFAVVTNLYPLYLSQDRAKVA